MLKGEGWRAKMVFNDEAPMVQKRGRNAETKSGLEVLDEPNQ